MSYPEKIIEALNYPFIGSSFSEICRYLKEHGIAEPQHKTVSKWLKKLIEWHAVTATFLYYPNGEREKLYTFPEYVPYQYVLSAAEERRAANRRVYRKYKKMQPKLET